MRLTRMTLATASSVLLLSALASCGNASDDTDDATATDQGTTQTGQRPAGGAMPGGLPGASGLVAAVDGRTAQVQSAQTGQVAVSWTSDTTFDQEVDGTLDDVQLGSCVRVTTDDEDTASIVRILPTADGECGFGGGEMPSGMPTDMPTDMPSDMPGGGRPGGGFGTVGEVTAVSADGFTVSSAMPGSDPVDVSVSVTADTTYVASAEATADAVEVGVCVNAQGEADDTGALAATSISLTKAVDGECTSGFGMVGRPGAAS